MGAFPGPEDSVNGGTAFPSVVRSSLLTGDDGECLREKRDCGGLKLYSTEISKLNMI